MIRGGNLMTMRQAGPVDRFVFSRGPSGAAFSFPQLIVLHSPTGMEFGYGGSGPADAALNVLIHFVNGETAWALHQKFKDDFIARLPREGGIITAEEVRAWLIRGSP